MGKGWLPGPAGEYEDDDSDPVMDPAAWCALSTRFSGCLQRVLIGLWRRANGARGNQCSTGWQAGPEDVTGEKLAFLMAKMMFWTMMDLEGVGEGREKGMHELVRGKSRR